MGLTFGHHITMHPSPALLTVGRLDGAGRYSNSRVCGFKTSDFNGLPPQLITACPSTPPIRSANWCYTNSFNRRLWRMIPMRYRERLCCTWEFPHAFTRHESSHRNLFGVDVGNQILPCCSGEHVRFVPHISLLHSSTRTPKSN